MQDAATPAFQSASPTITEREILTEQLRLVYAMLGPISLVTLLLSVMLAVLLNHIGPVIWYWLAAQLTLKGAEFVELKWFLHERDFTTRPEHMKYRLMVTQAMHAAGWAMLPVVAYPHISSDEMPLLLGTVAGIMGGAASTYGPLMPAFNAYVGTYLVVLSSLALTITVQRQEAYLTLVILLYSVGLRSNAKVTARSILNSILLRFENQHLNRQLELDALRLKQAIQDAEEANHSKSRFLAAASHDLRQPLQALSLFIGAIENEADRPAVRTIAAQARQAHRATADLLNTLLDFSRADAGGITPKLSPFALQDVFDQINAEASGIAQNRRLLFTVRDTPLHVCSDPVLTLIILRNLVQNALRYTMQGGVLVAARRRSGDAKQGVVIEVWDSGIGIPLDEQTRIFGDFVQLGNSERDRRLGLGLGLATARRIAHLLGSDITLRSEPGRGSVFRFALPELPEHREGLPAQPATVLLHPAAESAAPTPLAGLHILIIDDDEAIRASLARLITGWGASCAIADSRSEALPLVKLRQPDLLICDYRLRQGDTGPRVIAAICDTLGTDIPALLLTGDTQVDMTTEPSLRHHALMAKPVDPMDLRQTLEAMVADSHAPA